MSELLEQILALPKAARLSLATQILVSLQAEEAGEDAGHLEALAAFQARLEAGEVTYFSEEDFWVQARKRTLGSKP